jgi:hypothetical protein
VEVQAVVVAAPRAAHVRVAVDDDGVEALLLEGRRHGEAARPGADDDHPESSHGRTLPTAGAAAPRIGRPTGETRLAWGAEERASH